MVAPSGAFVEALGKKLLTLDKDFRYDTKTNGQGSMFRIYRDTRFSKDKTPYNTAARYRFWIGDGKKSERPGYFLGFDWEEWGIYAGSHGFEKSMLEKFRKAVADDKRGVDLVQAIAKVQKAGKYEVRGEEYKRVPRGYDPEHPRANLLRHSGVWANTQERNPDVITTPKFVDAVFRHFKNTAPIVYWLRDFDRWAMRRK